MTSRELTFLERIFHSLIIGICVWLICTTVRYIHDRDLADWAAAYKHSQDNRCAAQNGG